MICGGSWRRRTLAEPTSTSPPSSGRPQDQPLDVVRLPADRRPGIQPDVTDLRDYLAGRGPGVPGASGAGGAAGRMRRHPGRPAGRTAEQVFGEVDALKLRSSMTLFMHAAPGEPVFRQVLDRYFGGDARLRDRAAHLRPARELRRGTGRLRPPLDRRPPGSEPSGPPPAPRTGGHQAASAAWARAPASGVERSWPPASSRTGIRGSSARSAVQAPAGSEWAASTGRSG